MEVWDEHRLARSHALPSPAYLGTPGAGPAAAGLGDLGVGGAQGGVARTLVPVTCSSEGDRGQGGRWETRWLTRVLTRASVPRTWTRVVCPGRKHLLQEDLGLGLLGGPSGTFLG